MVKSKTNQSEICAKIGKCFAEESSSLAYVRIEGTYLVPLTCNCFFNIYQFVFFFLDNSSRVRRDDVIVGANKCTYGPAHWCASRENAKSCGVSVPV